VKIAVVDGQGGGIGKSIIEKLRKELSAEQAAKVTIIALGTNALATGSMLKAGADEGATGENAIVVTVETVDVILGPLGIVLANSILGELTPKMASAIASCKAHKFLIPMTRCGVEIVGARIDPLPRQIDALVEKTIELLD
jgi:NAD(P)-dependent dehydrogenase (short-subunit alcohol dehydrogenase family)